jgi:hypothetical protein
LTASDPIEIPSIQEIQSNKFLDSDREFFVFLNNNSAAKRFTPEQIAIIWMMTCNEAAFVTNHARRAAVFNYIAEVYGCDNEDLITKTDKVMF